MREPTKPTMTAEQLRQGRTPRRIGRNILVLGEVDSTNSLALQGAHEPDADGLTVFADAQLAGRGRLGRSWLSPRGASVLCSTMVLASESSTPDVTLPESAAVAASIRTAAWLTHVAGVAVCDAIRAATDVSPVIKWPNDILVGGRKLGGVLIESRPLAATTRAWVIGIGINCLQHAGHFPPELRATATSLEIESAQPIDRLTVARALLEALDHWLARETWGRTSAIHAAWLSYAEPVGKDIRLKSEGTEYEGWTVEIDPIGGLIVQLKTGQREWFDPMVTTLL